MKSNKEQIISDEVIRVFKLCHHDFKGLTVPQAAAKLGCTERNVYDLLTKAEEAMPSMFPILTPREQVILCLYSQAVVNREVIALGLGISIDTLEREVTWLREKGHLKNTVSYHPFLDNEVEEQF